MTKHTINQYRLKQTSISIGINKEISGIEQNRPMYVCDLIHTKSLVKKMEKG